MARDDEMTGRQFALLVLAGAIGLAAFGCVLMFAIPHYGVWQQGMAGKAKLAEAEFSRQVATAEAHEKMESSKLLAQAEVERAKGVAEAQKIIAEGLGGPNGEAYLRYLWLHNLESGNHDVIYIPTEANLPLLEARTKAPADDK